MSEASSGTVTETIYLETRELILAGTYAPGDVITPTALRNLFELKSVYAPRDALNALAVDGYLDVDVKLGFRVRLWTPSLLDRLFTSFANLQHVALTRAMERASDEVLASFVQDTETHARSAGSGDGALEAYHLFHGSIIRMSRIPRFAEMSSRVVAPAFHRRAWIVASEVPNLLRKWSWDVVARAMLERDVQRSAELLKRQIMLPRSAALAWAARVALKPLSSKPAELRRLGRPASSRPDLAFVLGATPWGITPRDRPSLVPSPPTSAAASQP